MRVLTSRNATPVENLDCGILMAGLRPAIKIPQALTDHHYTEFVSWQLECYSCWPATRMPQILVGYRNASYAGWPSKCLICWLTIGIPHMLSGQGNALHCLVAITMSRRPTEWRPPSKCLAFMGGHQMPRKSSGCFYLLASWYRLSNIV